LEVDKTTTCRIFLKKISKKETQINEYSKKRDI